MVRYKEPGEILFNRLFAGKLQGKWKEQSREYQEKMNWHALALWREFVNANQINELEKN